MSTDGRPAAIEVTDLTVAYGEKPVLWDVDVEVPQGTLTAIVGPNGAGKTTLIRAILGLVEPAAGRTLVLGGAYDANRRRVGYVPQRGSVDWDFPTDVLDVVLMGRYGHLGWLRRPRRVDRARPSTRSGASRWTRSLTARSPSSGGQQQRVFLARALVQDAELYLMDEPFQGVDATTERAIVELREPARGKTIVAVHHDLQTARVLRSRRAPQRPPHLQWHGRRGVHRGGAASDVRRTLGPLRHERPMTVAILVDDYTLRTVALGAALGIVSGALGTFAVLRRQALVGDAISHAALAGRRPRLRAARHQGVTG